MQLGKKQSRPESRNRIQMETINNFKDKLMSQIKNWTIFTPSTPSLSLDLNSIIDQCFDLSKNQPT
jgi:hypothetical protein